MTALKRYSRIRQRSPKAAKKAREWNKVFRMAIAIRGERCQCCGARKGLQGHHRLPRSRGGQNVMDNLAILCAECHMRCHSFPAWAEERGWIL